MARAIGRALMTLRQLADALLAAVLAPGCAVCGRLLERPLDGAVCDACWAACEARPAPFRLPAISRAVALGPYEGVLRDIVHALKYDGRRSVAPRLSRLMASHGQDVLAGAACAVPVPLHARRRRWRGFNQSEDLARHLGLPVVPALRRLRPTRPQVELPADERRQNVRDAFACGRAILRPPSIPFAGRVVVLVDDVSTTGATLEACARVLLAAGAAEVRALTAARAATAPRR